MTVSSRVRSLIRGGTHLTLRGVAKVLFILTLLVVAGIAISASAPIAIAALAMFLAYLMVRTILPAGQISAWLEDFWTGELFVNAASRVRGWFP